MPAEITVEVPEKDIAELSRIMALRAKLLKEDAEKTVTYTAWFIGKAAGAATKVAPKMRPIVLNPAYKTDKRAGQFAARAYGKSGARMIPIRAASKQEARMSKKAQVPRRGLARDSWRWIIGDLGYAPGQTWNQKKATYYGVTKALQQREPTITLTNKLNYADQAFKIKGRATVYNIKRRAANAMRKDLERRAKTTLAEANK